MATQDKISSKVVEHIIHLVTAPPAQDDSEAEWERVLLLDSAWHGHQVEYGDALLHDIQEAVSKVVWDLVNKAKGGAYDA